MLLSSRPLIAGEALPLHVCLEETARNNPELQAARAAVRQATADDRGARSPFYPSVNANSDFSHSRSGQGSSAVESERYSVGVNVRQNLFSGFQDVAGAARARAQLKMAESRLQKVKAAVEYDTTTAFIRLLNAQEREALARTIVGRRQDNEDLVELRYEIGREHKGSLLRSQAYSHQAGNDLAQARRALKVSRQDLARAMGAPQHQSLIVTGRWDDLCQGAIAVSDDESAADATPDVQEALWGLKAAEALVKAARGAFFPSLDARATAGRSAEAWPPEEDEWTVGAGISLPLFAGGQHLQAWKAAQAGFEAASAGWRSVRERTLFSLEDAFAAWEDAVGQLRVQNEFLRAAFVRSEIARGQYENGLLSFEDWDLIENDLINQQNAVLARQQAVAVARANWDKTKGESTIP